MPGPLVRTNVIFVASGPAWGRVVRPKPYPRQAKRESRRPRDAIPQLDRAELRRRCVSILRR